MQRYLYILFLVISAASCYKDIGNYSYVDIEEIMIENMFEKYPDQILFRDTLRINPTVKHRDGVFSYSWYRKISDLEMEFIHEGKKLVYPIVHSGFNLLYFKVRDEEIGYEQFQTTSFQVLSETSQGVYVLKENEHGATDIDLFISDTIVRDNLLSVKFGTQFKGKPLTIDYWGYQWADINNDTIIRVPSLRVVSDEELWVLDSERFTKVNTFDSLFMESAPQNREINAFLTVPKVTTLVNDGRVFLFNEENSSRFIAELMGDYELAPYLVSTYMGQAIYCYDQISQSFKYITTYTSRLQSFSRSVINGISLVNTGKSMRFFGQSKMALGVALLENNAKDSLFVYQLKFNPSNSSTITAINVDTLDQSYMMHQADIIAMHKMQDYLYYNVDHKIYCYDFASQKEYLVLETDGEITALDFLNDYYYFSDQSPIKPQYMKLVVSTYLNGNYSIKYYKTIANTLESTSEEYRGKGKVVRSIKVKKADNPIWMYYVNK